VGRRQLQAPLYRHSGDGKIDFTEKNGWNFPEGTVLVKTFLLDLEEKNPASRRRLETRLLTKQWPVGGYTYRWNDEQTEAFLVEGEAAMRRSRSARQRRKPANRRGTIRAEPSAWFATAGPRTTCWAEPGADEPDIQLRQGDRPSTRTLEHLGLFHINVAEHLRERRSSVTRCWETITGC